MPRTTMKLDDEAYEILEGLASDDGPYDSKSGAIRSILKDHDDLQRQVEGHERELAILKRQHADELQAQKNQHKNEIDELETELDRLHREKRRILEMREENTDLVRAVQREQSRQDRKATAGLLTRTKWWFTGMPDP